ncbi:efflux transporter outer membrane subunit [Variovorax sp. JS1663]|uniref:efflux transporter outer membrane subunit n=1 Tax=Variovorax sp. JS1663 TaxID=1851577 RepID=UPI000B342427|nr:efflux transporter outer membrane subunit [Variovorax sp. JS1663]OUL99491.1 multidrug transporter [Variovorax sp. JS1663]
MFTRPPQTPAPRAVRPLLALACVLSLAACAGLPSREPAPAIKAGGDYASSQAFTADTRPWPQDAWWTAYGDPQLDALIAEALQGAPSVAVAQARLRQAQALADSTAAARAPQLTANASVSAQKQSENYLSPASATPSGWHGYGRATLDLSWDLDLWGRQRAALAAATSEADAALADVAQARLVLATAIASAYAELARQHAALETAQAALGVRSRTATLFGDRFTHGLEIRGSVRQVDARRAAAEAELLAIGEQLALQRNRIAALMGAGPDRGLAIARPAVRLAQPFGLPAQLSAELLGRRPDLAAARLRAEAAARRIDQAEAAFYPNVNLVAFIGVQSLGLDMLTKSGSGIGSIGPAVSLPIFDGGRLRAQLRSADAGHAQAVADYERILVQALQEVADAAVSQRAIGAQLDKTGEAVDAAREAWRIQQERYEGGLATYLDVLNAEDSLLANLRTQSDLQSRSFALDVALVRALGGGYAAPQP